LEKDTPFWDKMHDIESVFHLSLEQNDLIRMTNQLLEADRLLWQAQLDLENPEFVSQGRELYREMIVLAGTGIEQAAQVIPRKFKTWLLSWLNYGNIIVVKKVLVGSRSNSQHPAERFRSGAGRYRRWPRMALLNL
jgi:hypothetical protein